MQRHFKVTPPTVHQMVCTLERAGLIRREPYRSAQVHGLTLVTRNTADFQASVKSLLNPWRQPTQRILAWELGQFWDSADVADLNDLFHRIRNLPQRLKP